MQPPKPAILKFRCRMAENQSVTFIPVDHSKGKGKGKAIPSTRLPYKLQRTQKATKQCTEWRASKSWYILAVNIMASITLASIFLRAVGFLVVMTKRPKIGN